MKINEAGRLIIKAAEGLQLTAYRCPAGVLTIGYGHTGDVQQGQKITEHQAEVILGHDLERFEEHVAKLAPKADANEFSALVSFAFNVGIASLANSTLLKLFMQGNKRAASEQFERWVSAKGKILPGLMKRRAAERILFLTPVS